MTQRLARLTTDLSVTIIHLHTTLLVINVFYPTTMTMYEHLSYPHIWMIIDLPFLSMKKFKLIIFLSKWLDRKPQSYWTTYLQTPMIGSGAPAQKPNRSITCNRLSAHLPVWFPDWQSCLFINYNCATAHSGYCLLNHRHTRQLMCEK